MSKKIAHIIAIIGILLIVSGLVITIVIDENKIKEFESTIELKDELIEQQGRTIVKLRAENEALWDNYYMNVSEYDGEYYE
jgi:hypothetical protein